MTVCFQLSVAILSNLYLPVLLLAWPIYPCWNSPQRIAAQQQQHKWQRLRARSRMLLLRSNMLGVEQRTSAEESESKQCYSKLQLMVKVNIYTIFSWKYITEFNPHFPLEKKHIICFGYVLDTLISKPVKLYCIVLYCIVLYCIVLYCIVLYCIVLYCIVLYCIVLYCINLL